MFDLLIQNGILSLPGEIICQDLGIRRGKIAAIGRFDEKDAETVVNAYGKVVLPGGVDAHTHMDLDLGFVRTADDFGSGTKAALAGGVTTIIDHIAFGLPGSDPGSRLAHYRRISQGKCYVDYSFHGVLQHGDAHMEEELPRLIREGYPSFKAYTTYDHRLDKEELAAALDSIRRAGGITAVHCEDHEQIQRLRDGFGESGLTAPFYHALSRPPQSESQAVEKVLALARQAGDAPVYLVHISAAPSVAAIQNARRAGQKNIFAETCPQYLLLDRSLYLRPEGLNYIMAPPLRQPEDQQALWRALAAGDIQAVATDHCAFTREQKKRLGEKDFRNCPGGVGGVEERMRLLYTYGVQQKRLTLEQYTDVCCANPARLFGLYPQKGALQIDSDADVLILDVNAKSRIGEKDGHGAGDFNAYQGLQLGCAVDTVILGGRIAYRQGEILAAPGWGRECKRHCRPDLWPGRSV
ncbi:MAG: dihydropyrimidinase [Firmicutes bacterium]|nr:dihydropyrimidinase [Bacillota bacterium]